MTNGMSVPASSARNTRTACSNCTRCAADLTQTQLEELFYIKRLTRIGVLSSFEEDARVGVQHALGVVQQECQDPGIVELEHPGLPQEGIAEGVCGNGYWDVVHAVLVVPSIRNPCWG